ncbi:MAG: F0F1 ATP synthase subunit B [Acidimicrobiales bacterium]
MLATITAGGTIQLAAADEHLLECLEEVAKKGGDPASCHEAPNPILPEANEIIWGFLSFAVLFLLLKKFAFPAVQKTMQARTDRIRESLDEAERTRADAERILEDYQRQLADARNESARIIEEARQTAEQMRRDLIARAEVEVAELRQRNLDDITAAQSRALADVRGQLAQIATEAAEVIVKKNLDRATQAALVEEYISQLGARA